MIHQAPLNPSKPKGMLQRRKGQGFALILDARPMIAHTRLAFLAISMRREPCSPREAKPRSRLRERRFHRFDREWIRD
jgi:hypothetical protein